jgi:eukaryotic-like serine/threonine-protein kinase
MTFPDAAAVTGMTGDDERPCEDASTGGRVEALLREIARPSLPAELPNARLRLAQEGAVIAAKYRIARRIGAGGMGIVFEALHLVSKKPVAIKWMPLEHARIPARLVAEARAVARIRHPNVVELYDVVSDESGAYLIMELLQGETLAERIARGPLEEDDLIELALPVLRGLAAVHARGVIHRDLKPENILLCEPPSGEGKVLPKLLDFGVSKILSPTEDGTRLTREGVLLGTPAFMSPEQLRDPSRVDARSDIYSMGVVLFEALAGTLPYDASGRDALILSIAEHRVRPIREVRPGLSRPLAEVIMRAMSADPDARYPDVGALIDALAEAQHGRRPARNDFKVRLIALAGLCGMAAVGAVAIGGIGPGRATQNAPLEGAKVGLPLTPADPLAASPLASVRVPLEPRPPSEEAHGQPTQPQTATPDPAAEVRRSVPSFRRRLKLTASDHPHPSRARAGELRIEDF